ncbi:MAG TPA: HEAT repeat domain-containing protein [Planctomycetota bacterium]|nr:HEAT repeat domain-containing protein [Planctomycetota bacterium]
MNPSFRAGLLAGFVAGALLAGLGAALLRRAPALEAPRTSARPAAEPEVAPALREEIHRLETEVARLRSPSPPAGAAPPAAEAPRTLAPDFKGRFAALAESGIAAFQSPGMADLVRTVKETGRPAVDFLKEVLRTSGLSTERFLAAALLEGAADPSAAGALAETLQNDKDDMVRRMASHALAVLSVPEGELPLRGAATGDSDWGVRVNSAYGLAKLGQEDGLKLLVDAYGASTTPGEYRLAILGGLADVAAPSTAPLFRQILSDTRDAGYLLMAIQALGKMRDADSLPALQQVTTSAQPDLVKQAATRAVELIQKGPGR